MRYAVKLTSQAIGQIEEIVHYISEVLFAPKTARKRADTLQSEIAKLNFMPSRCPLSEEEPWHTKGIRKMTVKNFLVYHIVDENSKTVWLTTVIYGHRDRIAALTDMSLDDTEQ